LTDRVAVVDDVPADGVLLVTKGWRHTGVEGQQPPS
jgi:hypothetical protein